MEDILIEIIRAIQNEKKQRGYAICHALKLEVYRVIDGEVTMALKNLHEQGRIKIGDTINDKYILLIEQDSAEKEAESK